MALLATRPTFWFRISAISILLILFFSQNFVRSDGESTGDEVALISFKSLVTYDLDGALASWGNTSIHFCNWFGVTCSNHSGKEQRVIALELKGIDLAGSISPSLGNLTFLKYLDISRTQLSGFIPHELGSLSKLEHLNLSYNSLSEYGAANQVSIEGDMYSFGIILLEMFTGRRPTDEIFTGSLNLHVFVKDALPERAMDIVDPYLLLQEEEDDDVGETLLPMKSISKYELECIISVLKVGLLCSEESPTERMQISQAFNELYAIRNVFLKSANDTVARL